MLPSHATALNPAFATLCQASVVLLLQGPLGPFFDRLARWLQSHGKKVCRIALHGGDRRDSRAVEPLLFSGRPEDWPEFLESFIRKRGVDAIVLFGQMRAYHVAAKAVADRHGVKCVVLEEGYFRPGFVTMELDGVNANSRTLERFQWTGELPAPDITRAHFAKMSWHATWHYLALWAGRSRFRHYQHHRNPSPWHYMAYWLRTWWRKAGRHHRDHRVARRLLEQGTPYYFVPLQNDGDAQITHHSPYVENSAFIMEVLCSFAWHAPKDSCLVFRIHPYARGGHGHKALIRSAAKDLGIADRVFKLMEGNTPLLAERSRGVVLINSTVGLQALERGAPVMALGEASYRDAGLTFKGNLDDFWTQGRPADPKVAEAFLRQLKGLTQMPASVYANADEPLKWLFPSQVPESPQG